MLEKNLSGTIQVCRSSSGQSESDCPGAAVWIALPGRPRESSSVRFRSRHPVAQSAQPVRFPGHAGLRQMGFERRRAPSRVLSRRRRNPCAGHGVYWADDRPRICLQRPRLEIHGLASASLYPRRLVYVEVSARPVRAVAGTRVHFPEEVVTRRSSKSFRVDAWRTGPIRGHAGTAHATSQRVPELLHDASEGQPFSEMAMTVA